MKDNCIVSFFLYTIKIKNVFDKNFFKWNCRTLSYLQDENYFNINFFCQQYKKIDIKAKRNCVHAVYTFAFLLLLLKWKCYAAITWNNKLRQNVIVYGFHINFSHILRNSSSNIGSSDRIWLKSNYYIDAPDLRSKIYCFQEKWLLIFIIIVQVKLMRKHSILRR